jgi:hypothetical protein
LKSSRRYVSIFAVLFAISISLAFISGCSQNLVSPAKDDPNQQKLDWLNQFLKPGGAQLGSTPFGDCVILYDTLITKWVYDEDVEFASRFGAERIDFRLPKHAVHDRTKLAIHVTKYQAPFGSFWLLDCGPDGTVFSKPLEVEPNHEATQNNSSVLFYFNPTAGLWEVQDVESTGDALSIGHFSKYGIS